MPYVEGGGEWSPPPIRNYMAANKCDFSTAVRKTSFEPNLEGSRAWLAGLCAALLD
jgi:hypothetical protein